MLTLTEQHVPVFVLIFFFLAFKMGVLILILIIVGEFLGIFLVLFGQEGLIYLFKWLIFNNYI